MDDKKSRCSFCGTKIGVCIGCGNAFEDFGSVICIMMPVIGESMHLCSSCAREEAYAIPESEYQDMERERAAEADDVERRIRSSEDD